jgi:hypothetical protein
VTFVLHRARRKVSSKSVSLGRTACTPGNWGILFHFFFQYFILSNFSGTSIVHIWICLKCLMGVRGSVLPPSLLPSLPLSFLSLLYFSISKGVYFSVSSNLFLSPCNKFFIAMSIFQLHIFHPVLLKSNFWLEIYFIGTCVLCI